MVTDQNQPDPVQPSIWTKPNNSTHLTFFPINFWTPTWAKPNIWTLLFSGPWPSYIRVSGLLISNDGPTSQTGPSCQVLVSGPQLSGSSKWVPVVRVIFLKFLFFQSIITNIKIRTDRKHNTLNIAQVYIREKVTS